MQRFKLALGIHNHQPIGNFDSVFQEAHDNAYRPFLELFDQFDELKMSLHQSGILWVWQEEKDPAYLDLVQKLIYDDRLEILTGGFYEPILPAIPDCDKIGQITMLNRYLAGRFGADPTGLWLTERVWEPHLPKALRAADVEYLAVDDTHFLYAGFEPEQLRGVFMTEEEGAVIKLLPIQKKLRYLIPFGTVDDIIEELKKQAEKNPGGLAVYADDGEKFGVWPQTHQHCYQDGWLKDFFEALAKNSDWLEICTLGRAALTKPVGRAYLPTASYAEMLHWSLPPRAFVDYEEFETWLKDSGRYEKYFRFVRGGHWRGFLAKYDEANLMHKRMLRVSRKLQDYLGDNPTDYDIVDKARHHLYAGQCNCPYWHGVFGGLYLPHIRKTIYENLIAAEKLISPEKETVEKAVFDYDADGHDEVVLSGNKLTGIIKPAYGGMLVELDNNEKAFNIADTLTRRREGYHRKLSRATLGSEPSDKTESIHDIVLTKEKGLEKFLSDDWYLRRCFIDHFFSDETGLKEFATGEFGEDGDFIVEPYRYDWKSEPGSVHLTRHGRLWRGDGVKALQVDKSYYFAPNSEVITLNYALLAEFDDISGVRFGIENNFNLQAGHDDNRYILYDGSRGENSFLDAHNLQTDCRSVILRDDYSRIAVALMSDRPAEIWQVPIFTISSSEGGFEKVYQGTSLVYLFTLDLPKGRPVEITMMLFCGDPDNMPHRLSRKIKDEDRIKDVE